MALVLGGVDDIPAQKTFGVGGVFVSALLVVCWLVGFVRATPPPAWYRIVFGRFWWFCTGTAAEDSERRCHSFE